MTDSRFIHTSTNDTVLFLFMSEYYSIVYVPCDRLFHLLFGEKYMEVEVWKISLKSFLRIPSFRKFVRQFSRSVVSDSATPWTAACQASLSVTSFRSLLKLVSIVSMMPCPLLLLPSVFPSIRVFPNESVLCIRWPKYWIYSFNISPSNEYSGLMSFPMDWLDLIAVQGTLKSLLPHHSLKASILRC